MPGMTFKSISAALLGLVVMAILVELLGVFAAPGGALYGTEAIPLSALDTFAVLALFSGGFYFATRLRLFTGAEMLCILYVLLIAAPLLTTGFWRCLLSNCSGVVKQAYWEDYDILSPKLWPHGPDLIGSKMEDPHAAGLDVTGPVTWEKLAVAQGKSWNMPVLENSSDGQTSSVRMRLPVEEKGQVVLPLNEPYLLTMRTRAQNLHAHSRYFARIYYDDSPVYDSELFSSLDQKKVTFLQPEGFIRTGTYGFILPTSIRDHIVIEIGLSGVGRLEIANVNFFNVATLQDAYTGRKQVSREVFEQLPQDQRGSLVVLPASLFSLEGMKFLLNGYVPWAEWRDPLLFWGGYIALILAATFALACLMRRQWIESERFALPMTQITTTLTGLDAQFKNGLSYMQNPFLWLGFGLMLVWTLNNSLRAYFSSLPDLTVAIPLKPYLPDPSWGKTWETSFTFKGLLFSLGLLMEINVLLSMILGYFLFRFQYWFGQAKGLISDVNYPYVDAQETGAFLSYGIMTLWIARRFLAGSVRAAFRGEETTTEVLSSRIAYLVLLAALAGIGGLAAWAGINPPGMLILALCVFLFLVVAMKLRVETGYPTSGFLSTIFVFTLFGSFSTFSPETALFWAIFAITFFSSSIFPLVPGLQMELVALGHRLGLRRRDIILACAMGIAGGIFIGGWVYLSGAYALGADNFPITGEFNSPPQTSFINDAATRELDKMNGNPATASWFTPQYLAFYFSAGVTILLTLVRQMFSGFWFHPIGFILGSSQMMEDAWGSLTVAMVLRYAVLKLGGAATVRQKLLPFAVGCILAIVTTSIITSLFQGYAYFFVPGGQKPTDVF
jgi:hypothetical protein